MNLIKCKHCKHATYSFMPHCYNCEMFITYPALIIKNDTLTTPTPKPPQVAIPLLEIYDMEFMF